MEKVETNRIGQAVGDPETDNRPEFRLSYENQGWFYLDTLIRLAQVRKGRNPIQDSLNESIEKRRKIMHDMEIGRMTKEGLADYISVVNQVWSSQYDIDQFHPDIDGKYNLIIAGHSRYIAAEETARQHPEFRHSARCTYWDDPPFNEIMAVQLEENLHHQPSIERQAKSTVSIYKMGLIKNCWNSIEEFVALEQLKEAKITDYKFKDFLAYAELYPSCQELVEEGAIAYSAILEFGRSLDDIRSYWGIELTKGLDACDLRLSPLIDEHAEKWILEQCTYIRRKKMSAKTSEKFIKARVRELRIKMMDEAGREQAALDGWNEYQLQNALESARRRDEDLISATKAITMDQLAKGALATRIIGERVNHGQGEQMIRDVQRRFELAAKHLGSDALNQLIEHAAEEVDVVELKEESITEDATAVNEKQESMV